MIFGAVLTASAQDPAAREDLEVTARIQPSPSAGASKRHGEAMPSAVLWLKPLSPGLSLPSMNPQRGGYSLLQKNKMFSPHLLVVPAGSDVMFPNADPFFHNVFSLFDGKRFDLGLYEAGKTKAVNFSREGVSYIFCNIHSEMSAVVIALSTPLYGIASADGALRVERVPVGDYEMHLWVEGEPQSVLDRWVHRVRITPSNRNLGTITLDSTLTPSPHANKYGKPYEPESNPPY